jgi:hypothetical protein
VKLSTDRRRRPDPAINRALRAFNLPPLLTTRADAPEEDAEPMSRGKAAVLIAFYTLAYGPAALLFFGWAMHGAHRF